jgi:ubiquinone/menaquinone biosynthesis C-methylase UbiE
MISGDPNQDYLHVLANFLNEKKGLSLISLGSGRCEAEIKLAKTNIFDEITCIELSKPLVDEARKSINHEGLKNIHVVCDNIYEYKFKENAYDVVFFSSSLHHFKNLDTFLRIKAKAWLKKKRLFGNE